MELSEAVGDLSPGQGSFNARTGKWTRVYYVGVTAASQLTDAVRKILGRTLYWGNADGKLRRDLPLADPQFPWLYADSISGIAGMGMKDPGNLAGQQPGAVPAFQVVPSMFERPHELIDPEHGLYPVYALTVEFSPRPFKVLSDAAVTMAAGSWFNWLGGQQPFTYATEYVRFLDEVRQGAAEAVSGQQGTMVFRSTGSASGRTFPARPRMYLPNETLSIVWFNVPYRYVTSANSYIAGRRGQRPWFGCVNQNAVEWLGMVYPAGSLLYLNYQISTRFPAAVDSLVPTIDGDVYGVYKFVDITLNFGVTWRTAPAGTLPATVPSPNFVRAGWNLQPWLVDRRFHYASSNVAAQMPSHYSFPAELLFTDPDFAQAVSND